MSRRNSKKNWKRTLMKLKLVINYLLQQTIQDIFIRRKNSNIKNFWQKCITRIYKKFDKKKINSINFTAKKITEKLAINNRILRLEESVAYITLKDHKVKFSNKISCRLIIPSKSNPGKISKVISDKINQHLVGSTDINQGKNT